MPGNHNIKNLKPSKKSRYSQSYINPDSCKKLFESQKGRPIICRSSWEKKFIQWLERTPSVIRWGSECVAIPYTNLADGTHHTYNPDFIIEKEDGIYLIEVKPYNQTIPPDPAMPKDSYAWKEYIRNRSKWEAAKSFCEHNNMKFKIITEHSINRM